MENKNDVFKVDESQQGSKQKKVVFVLGIAIVIVAITLTVILIAALASAGGKDESDIYETTEGSPLTTTADELNMDEWLGSDGSATEGAGDGNNGSAVKPNGESKSPVISGTTENDLVESYENLPVNGENKLSDHYNNQYIKLIADNYDVDSDLLVAIYSVPDTGTNFVLEFSGKTKLDGEYVKSPDTLVKVYQIDKEQNIKIATGKPTGNVGVSYPESVMIVAMVRNTVMKQHPDYFSGVN